MIRKTSMIRGILMCLGVPLVGPVMAAPLVLCGEQGGSSCVVDGDTFRWRGVKIRLADIDAPEIGQARCELERRMGIAAKHRLAELLGEGEFTLAAWPGRDEDRYGRKLRVVVREGRSIGDVLVEEGLARTWEGRRRPWCGKER